jgi:hypothetical protein
VHPAGGAFQRFGLRIVLVLASFATSARFWVFYGFQNLSTDGDTADFYPSLAAEQRA